MTRLAVLVVSVAPSASAAWAQPPCGVGPVGRARRGAARALPTPGALGARVDASTRHVNAATWVGCRARQAGRACTRARGGSCCGRARATLAAGLLRAARTTGGVQWFVALATYAV